LQPGGQLTTTTEVENFPGFAEGILGPRLMLAMADQAKRVGAQVIGEEVTSIVREKSGGFSLVTSEQETLTAKTVIIATGATAKTVGLEDEWRLMGRGVSTCATCDGFFFKGEVVAVIGGGDSAMEEALYLANICKHVYLVHRRDSFRASAIMLERARAHKNITFKVSATPKKLLSDEKGIVGLRVESAQKTEDLAVSGIFYAIGHTPNAGLFTSLVDLDSSGYIKVENFVCTKTPGLFAAGDIADPKFKQAITAAGMGCQAAITAARYIESL
jgi:thioredoxin reductase (NADPH)